METNALAGPAVLLGALITGGGSVKDSNLYLAYAFGWASAALTAALFLAATGGW